MRRHKTRDVERAYGDGFYVHTEYSGRSAWFYASHLDSPGGYVQKGRHKAFPYLREAEQQIASWKAEDAAA